VAVNSAVYQDSAAKRENFTDASSIQRSKTVNENKFMTLAYLAYVIPLVMAFTATALIMLLSLVRPVRVKDKFKTLRAQVDKKLRSAAFTGGTSTSSLKDIRDKLNEIEPLLEAEQYRLAEFLINSLRAKFAELAAPD
jgi:hypothetical protein